MWPPVQNSKVTVDLRDLVESGVDLWAFDYPSYYKGDAKKAFEQKVLDHFWLRQIGAETPGRFLLYFRRTMNEIMPYYIQRYESVDLMKDPEIRPLDNYNMIEEYDSKEGSTKDSLSSGTLSNTTTSSSTDTLKENTTGSSASSGKETEVHSDTPQGTLNISIPAYPLNEGSAETIDHASDVTQRFNGSHANDTRDNTRNGTSSADANVTGSSSDTLKETNTGNQSHKLTRRGNIGVTTYAQLLEGYRETFLNIDMEIINELESCFLGVF